MIRVMIARMMGDKKSKPQPVYPPGHRGQARFGRAEIVLHGGQVVRPDHGHVGCRVRRQQFLAENPSHSTRGFRLSSRRFSHGLVFRWRGRRRYSPDTDNFWKILNAELHSRHPEVTVDVNTKGVARAKEQMRDLDGKTLTNVVKIDGDRPACVPSTRPCRPSGSSGEEAGHQQIDLDDTSFNEKIHRLSNQIKRTAGQTEAFVKKSQKSVADSLQDSLSRMRSARALYDKEATAASRRQTMLIKDEHAAYDMYAEAIENGRKRQEQLTRSQADVSKTLDWSIKKMKELQRGREHRHRELVQEQSHPRAARTAQRA